MLLLLLLLLPTLGAHPQRVACCTTCQLALE
jgi:hypothetical protein